MAPQEGTTSTARCRSQWSASTTRAMASTMGTVVAATGLQGDRVVVDGDRVVGRGDGRRGLEGHPDHHVTTGADTALDAARPVGGRHRTVGAGDERVVVLAAGHGHRVESAPHVEALGRRQGEHGLGQVGLQAVEHRCAEAGRYPAGHTGHDPTQRVAVMTGRVDGRRHGGRGCRVGTPGRISLDRLERHEVGIHVGHHVMDPGHPSQDLDAGLLGQEPSSDGPGSYPPDGLARTRAAAAPPVAVSVLGLVGEVGMRGAVEVPEMVVGARAGVVVADQDGDRGAGGPTLEHPGEDLGPVGLAPLGGQSTLAGSSTVEVVLEVVLGEGEPGRAAVDHHADAGAVALTPGAEAEDGSEGAAHGGRA